MFITNSPGVSMAGTLSVFPTPGINFPAFAFNGACLDVSQINCCFFTSSSLDKRGSSPALIINSVAEYDCFVAGSPNIPSINFLAS